MNRKGILAVLGLAFVLGACSKGEPQPVPRDALLPVAKVRPIFEGNTLEVVQVRDNSSYLVYFAKNGLAVIKFGEIQRKGRWHIQDDGKHCLQLGGASEQCRFVASDGHGKYFLVDSNLKPVWYINSITAGVPKDH